MIVKYILADWTKQNKSSEKLPKIILNVEKF